MLYMPELYSYNYLYNTYTTYTIFIGPTNCVQYKSGVIMNLMLSLQKLDQEGSCVHYAHALPPYQGQHGLVHRPMC